MAKSSLIVTLGFTVATFLIVGTDGSAQSMPKPPLPRRSRPPVFAPPGAPLSPEEQEERDAWLRKQLAECTHPSRREGLPQKQRDNPPVGEPRSSKDDSEESFMFQCLKNILKNLGM